MSFAAGHVVGDLACQLIPDGIMVEINPDMKAALEKTNELVSSADRPIFEATFAYDGVLVRVDILTPEMTRSGKMSWHIAEVKSSGSVKPYHTGDLATQYWVIENSGVKIASAAIRHLDTQFVLEAEGKYDGIFQDSHLLEVLKPIAETRAGTVKAAREMLTGKEPVCDTGPHCSSPFECEFIVPRQVL